ncbi:conserved hypothetical protein [Sulfurihydrogenibium azorense Az-Fu1]|uniref:Prevent-host-death family protein n=1 Tax=Sulfurihydrogenibium azorense (strain DSM 15241 / OCM 825 / Az-Fu1) TaxID=204536 RepID=C1DUR6_SULAA|nr:hypothetical protein [Sulfurihydrogenibium azorense]ACN99048.1 conserved hypothetical protein [Sulfurihydrogenibium azorense Az-Fu1]
MKTLTIKEAVKKPSNISNPKEITYILDSKEKKIKSVVIPYEMYLKVKEELEAEEFLKRNYKTLMSEKNYKIFKETTDNIAEDL